jgi:methionyl-tRNA formyltransferase
MLLVEKHALYVACGPEGSGGTWLALEEVQPENRKRLRATDFINGLHVKTGERFESPP